MKFTRCISIIFAVLFLFTAGICQDSGKESKGLTAAVQLIAAGQKAEGIKILESEILNNPSESAYYILGNAYMQQSQYAKAAELYAKGAEQFPLSARLHYAAGNAYEQQFIIDKALKGYRAAFALDPGRIYSGIGHYDPEFDGIFLSAVHDHAGARNCQGRLFVDSEQLHYVAYLTTGGDDDSFKVKYSNIKSVEVDRKKGAGGFTSQYLLLLNLINNLTTPRRLVFPDEIGRIDIKFEFDSPVEGYRSKWKKDSFKFFFLEVGTAEGFVKYLGQKGLKVEDR